MKRFIIMFFMLGMAAGLSFGQDDSGSFGTSTGNFGLSVYWESASDAKVKEALVWTSFMGGIGGHLNIVPNIISPGIYADIHVSILSFIFGALVNTGDNSYDNYSFMFVFQGGVRVYNQFKFGPVVLQPFFGLTGYVKMIEAIALETVGLLVAFGNWGVEYSYHFPLIPAQNNKLVEDMHRLAFVRHF